MKKTCALLALCLLLAVPGLARAALVTYDFAGVINNVMGVPGMSYGQAYTGWLTYDNAVLLHTEPIGLATRDSYVSTVSFGINAGGVGFTGYAAPKNPDPAMDVMVINGPGMTSDSTTFIFHADSSVTRTGMWSGYTENLFLDLVFTDMPGQMPIFRYMYGLQETGQFQPTVNIMLGLDGTVTSLSERPTPTPLPAAVWLLGSGLAGLAGVRRLRRR